ncbi:transcriptional regulator [Candidatus Thiosymbion oneisti]|uniref:HVO_A0114 family putative DNA-binding protein n=1 Tax=Candidatus Thiosymbion oneisti TaxID=589554 RepID=UPI001060E928|nr:transcriptional regulator [Candidatus Thiosymbion oneisti]
MNRIEISVLKPDAALRAFAGTWQVADAGHAVTPRLAFGSLRELFSAITEKRLDLLRHLAVHEGLNVKQLAKSLRRDYKNVHTDVTSLVELGLVDRDTDGTLSTPYDEIIIHAGIRDAA